MSLCYLHVPRLSGGIVNLETGAAAMTSHGGHSHHAWFETSKFRVVLQDCKLGQQRREYVYIIAQPEHIHIF